MSSKLFSPRELMLWTLSHAILLPGMMQVVQDAFRDDSGRADQFVIFTIPTVIGLLQTIFLRRHVRHVWLWLPLTLIGLVLAFILGLGWMFMFTMGFGFGLAQWPLLYFSRLRSTGLWILCSGFGWIGGAVADSWLAPVIFGNATDKVRYAFMFVLFGLVYATATGLYLYSGSLKGASTPQVATDVIEA